MVWIVIAGGLAAVGLVVLAVLANGVRHKLADVLDEVRYMDRRRAELRELTARIQLPPRQPN